MGYLALNIKKYGPPDVALELVEIPFEEPRHNEVVVSIDAVGMHIADGLAVRGEETLKPLASTPGFEGVGTIKKVGKKVSILKEGDKVLLPMGTGSMRQELKIKAQDLTKIKQPYAPDEQLSLITVNGFTAYFLLKDFVNLKKGDWLIQNAANSNVGRYLIALAKIHGIRTLNIVRRKEVMPELKKLGATKLIMDYELTESVCLKEILKKNITLGIDAVAGEATESLAKSLADKGLLINYGTVTKQPCHITFWTLFRKDIKLCGMSTLNGFDKRTKKRVKEIHQELASLVNKKSLQTKIAATYSIENYLSAYKHIDKSGNERDGKIVLLPNH